MEDAELPMDDATRLEIFRKALFARRLEERIVQLAMGGELAPTLHPGAGQEVCQIAALAALRPDDPLLYGHRGLAYWIARGLEPETILCELGYREGSTNRGKGGVMHVVDAGRGILGESGTLGGNFVVGAGVALADRFLGRDAVTIVFFGDGTANRGPFHEAANFAAVRKLPCLFFCENNGWAVSVSAAVSTSVEDIADRAAGYGMPGRVVDGSDAEAVYGATAEAAERARRGEGPSLLEAKVPRLRGHFIGDPETYRSAEERASLAERDPLLRLQRELEERGQLDAAALEALERESAERIAEAASRAAARPRVDAATAFENVYAP